MTSVDTTGPSTRATDPTPYVIKIPANRWLGIEKIPVAPDGPGLKLMQEIVGGHIEHLSILESRTNYELRATIAERDWVLDAWGHDEARYGRVVPANSRATLLLGYPPEIQQCLVGDILLTSFTEDGDTTPLPEGVWEWFMDANDMVPGLG